MKTRSIVRRLRWLAGLAGCLAVGGILTVGCTDKQHYAQAVCVLVDVSGTYADQKGEVVDIVKKAVLPGLLPGDTLVMIRIDSRSYEKANVVATVSLEGRPSQANAQKMRFAKQLDQFAAETKGSQYTDIHGALMLASEYLKETGAGNQTIVVFSDMKEELPKGSRRELSDHEFDNVRIVAVNVRQLRHDSEDPMSFRKRLSTWEKRLVGSGAREWRVIADSSKLVEYLEERI